MINMVSSSDPVYVTATRSPRVMRIAIADAYHDIPMMDSMPGVLRPVMISEPDFVMNDIFRPSQPRKHRLGLAPAQGTEASAEHSEEEYAFAYEAIVLKGYHLELLSQIDTSGKKCRIIPPQAPKPSGCKGVLMADLPLDVLNLIYETFQADDDNCTAVCLALTCRGFFSAYKAMNPGPIDIWTFTQFPMWAGPCPRSGEIIVGTKSQWLGELLGEWVGPKYRQMRGIPSCETSLRKPFRPFFLHVDTYGDSTTLYDVGFDKEVRMIERYQDWWKSAVSVGDTSFHVLPSPYDKGENWYEQARLVMLRDAERRESWGDWTRYWLESQVYQQISYMEKLKVADGFKEREEVAKKKGRVVCKLGKATRFIARQVNYLRYRLKGMERGVLE